MKIDERILTRLQVLIQDGERLLRASYDYSSPFAGPTTMEEMHGRERYVDRATSIMWHTQCMAFAQQTFGSNSEYYKSLVASYSPSSGNADSYAVAEGSLAVMKAALLDYEAGYIFRLKELVRSDLLDGFIDQAMNLLDSRYVAPAMVVVGCALEDALRAICLKHETPLSEKPKLDAMNSELAKKEVYNKSVQKQITAIADRRNLAAHGKWSELKFEDVQADVLWVRRFLSDYL